MIPVTKPDVLSYHPEMGGELLLRITNNAPAVQPGHFR